MNTTAAAPAKTTYVVTTATGETIEFKSSLPISFALVSEGNGRAAAVYAKSAKRAGVEGKIAEAERQFLGSTRTVTVYPVAVKA